MSEEELELMVEQEMLDDAKLFDLIMTLWKLNINMSDDWDGFYKDEE